MVVKLVGGDSASRSGITFGKRLEAMETEEVVDVMTEMITEKKPKELPKAGSLEVLISQYLDSGNYFQMESIINATSRKVLNLSLLHGRVSMRL